jgi:hypothetical protein
MHDLPSSSHCCDAFGAFTLTLNRCSHRYARDGSPLRKRVPAMTSEGVQSTRKITQSCYLHGARE